MDQLRTNSPRRIELEGEYDGSQREQIAALFGSLRADGPVVIDLTKVTFIDSTFLHLLAALRLRFKGQSITLTGATANIKRVLKLVKFEQLFVLADQDKSVAEPRPASGLSEISGKA
ncbi:MAG TPA: STAS domain-containing protein [Candidatus Acidoferrum sp.]|nr:STAS domain-containing protein [Candidatus Acidoferrum sp.]